jgi:hypothetical protein
LKNLVVESVINDNFVDTAIIIFETNKKDYLKSIYFSFSSDLSLGSEIRGNCRLVEANICKGSIGNDVFVGIYYYSDMLLTLKIPIRSEVDSFKYAVVSGLTEDKKYTNVLRLGCSYEGRNREKARKKCPEYFNE